MISTVRHAQIWGFYTLDDLEFLLLQHQNKKTLRMVRIDENIAGRTYQIEGVKRVYEAYESGRTARFNGDGHRIG